MDAELSEQNQTLAYNHYPRQVDSLCPDCLKPIKATIKIKGNSVVMEKSCPTHGDFSDTLSKDKDFYIRMEKLSFGDGPGIANPMTVKQKGCPQDCGLCTEHKSTTMMGIIDLTNKCNLKCPFCFATSDASGYIYQPSYEQVIEMMNNLLNLKPAHTPCLQFSGGEPTLHPDFFKILKKARQIGFTQLNIATNGITLADEEFAKKAAEAGLNVLYLQFDGISDDVYLKTRGRKLIEIKLKAIENARKNNMRVILVPTLIKGINNHQIGDIYKFAIDNLDVIGSISWQPVSLTGRIPPEKKDKMRYTNTDIALDTEAQFPYIKKSDWVPLGFVSPFSRFLEIIKGSPQSQISCHSHCGIGTYLVVNKKTGKTIPIPRFVDVIGLMTKFQEIYKNNKDKYFKSIRVKFNMLNYAKEFEQFYNQSKAPDNMPFSEFIKFLNSFAERKNFMDNLLKKKNLQERKWHFLVIASMHFQDAYNYEAARSQRCVVHYAAPDGKIYPFCTYNSGLYFRDKVEKQFSKPLK